jgi:MFS family permease
VLLTFQAASWTTMAPEVLANLAAGIFILPFFLFSATAGQLADKYDKALLARLVKVLEIVIMAVAVLGFFAAQPGRLLLAALFLLGLHSTLFGPVKYAILPQHLREGELVGGNALVEAGTFVAILIGTLAGGLLAGAAGHPTWVASPACWSPCSATCAAAASRRRRRRFPNSGRRPQSAVRNLAQHRLRAPEPDGLPVDPRHLVVLALRRAVPRPVPGLRQKRARRRRDAVTLLLADVHGRHRPRFAALRAAVGRARRNRPGAFRFDRPDAVRHRPAFASPALLPAGAPLALASLLAAARRLARALRPVRARRFRRLLHRAAVC